MPPFMMEGACRTILTFCMMLMVPMACGATNVSDEDWIVFYREADPSGFIISVDQAVTSGRATISSDCHEMSFQFAPAQLSKKGMPNAEAQTVCHSVEDRVTKVIEPVGGQIVAMRTGQNSRSVWLCGPKTIVPAVQTAIDATTDYRIILRPASLSDIRALHPTVLESQLTRNRQLFDQMAQEGDDQSVPRKTSHFIYGHTSSNRSLIEARLKTLGFQLDPNRPDINPALLVFFRFASFELDALDSDVRALSKLCAEFACDYDGWETEFVKSSKN